MKNIIADGNTAASIVAYRFSENVAIYPITPSSPMAENIDEWKSQNKKNLFGKTVCVNQFQSEAGAAGGLHGLASAGALASSFTSSQGLLLMIPNMFKIAGENLPCTLHVAARAVATHALSIFGDHSDVMATRGTGFAMLCSSNPQEAHDLAAIAHMSTLEGSVPFLHFFDGFRTSHELRNISVLEENELDSLIDKKLIEKFKKGALNSAHPTCRGTSQNPDIFFQNREANNPLYAALPNIVEKNMEKFRQVSGREYHLFNYFGSKNAKVVAVVLGSAAETLESVCTRFNAGVVSVKLFRPFSIEKFLSVIPKSCKKIVVLDRCKEDGAVFDPLCQDVISAVKSKNLKIEVIGGRFGLGGKDFTPADAISVFENALKKKPKNHFTVGICDDVSHASLPPCEFEETDKTLTCKFFGLGSDGTVSANKSSLKIIGENCGKFVQGYFEYDSKKSGSITTSHIRIADKEIKKPYLAQKCDFMACHHPSFISKFEMLAGLKSGGIFLLNTPLEKEDLIKFLPTDFKRQLFEKNISFYTINASKLASEIGLGSKINLIMQSAFFYLINIIDFEKAKQEMKEFAKKSYGKKGEQILNANFKAIDLAQSNIQKVVIDKNMICQDAQVLKTDLVKDEYYNSFIKPITKLEGNSLPVSTFKPNGEVPTNTTKFEKRGICNHIPDWNSEKCIQCGLCSLVCPHSCIRPTLVPNGKKVPKSFTLIPSNLFPGFSYRVQVSALDCTGCGHCAKVCPTKAISLRDATEIVEKEIKNYNFSLKQKVNLVSSAPLSPKTLQFKKPLFEFCGACSGCGETPYIKILTQLFGDHLIIANATGCSSIYGGNSPTCPYAKNEEGRGPAWQNSLFEDNAEFGFGLYLAYKGRREKIKENLKSLMPQLDKKEAKIVSSFLDNFSSAEKTKVLAPEIEKICKKQKSEFAKNVLVEKDALVKQTFWIIGGDGWAYDIGFGGLDHVLAQNEDIKVLVLDTNVYSNTGGQQSKATPLGAVAKFASSGKTTKKKDLAAMFMTYGDIYVAQIALGANMAQTINALVEAEKYNGSAIVIAYSTCINQGFDLKNGLEHQKDAVACGLWNLFRFNPSSEKPFTLDFPAITKSIKEFCLTENRFKLLQKSNKEQCEKLLDLLEKQAKEKMEKLKSLNSK